MQSHARSTGADWRRKLTFAALYLSEGAPIGYLWLALPTRLRAQGVPLEQITWLAAILVLPWTFKFVWAPLIDLLRFSAWGFKHWIFVAQTLMGLTLLPFFWLDPVKDFYRLATIAVVHAFCAATQDVSIDGLCISTTVPQQRGELNGWMQLGMFVGRAMMGGGALVLSRYIGNSFVLVLLIGITTFSMFLLLWFPVEETLTAQGTKPMRGETNHLSELGRALYRAARSRNTWLGFAFAFVGGASFKSFEIIYGPFLVDRGYAQEWIGWFSAGPMIVAMVVGALIGGRLADRRHRRMVVGLSLGLVAGLILSFALVDALTGGQGGVYLWVGLVMIGFAIGMFTATSYAFFMDLTSPRIAAAQFSGFMGATNGCESWSTYVVGKLISAGGYGLGIATMSLVSLAAISILWCFRFPTKESPYNSSCRRSGRPSPTGNGYT